MNKTYMQKPAQVKREWRLVDAKGQVLGRLATQLAQELIGKHKPTYTPHVDGGDYVVVINASQVVLTRDKAQQKVYRRHSQYPGGLKEVTFQEMIEKQPEKIIELAVKNMLPKNKLRQLRMARLKVYANDQHPHQSQINYQATPAKKK